MELKNAIAVCLISLFSATLVVLIARALDSQAAARLEPQLVRIADELQALRQQGGIATAPTAGAGRAAAADGLVVYYFHGNTRCPTCQAIEAQSHETVQAGFQARLDRGDMTWKILNYEQPAGVALAKKFDVQMPVVVLARMKAGQIQDWKRLDEVWALVGDQPAFAAFLTQQVKDMLEDSPGRASPAPAAKESKPGSSPIPANLPLPTSKPDLPLPK